MSDQVFKYVQHQDMTSGEWDSTYGHGEAGAGDEGYYGEAGGAGERDGASGGDES